MASVDSREIWDGVWTDAGWVLITVESLRALSAPVHDYLPARTATVVAVDQGVEFS